MIGSYPDIPSKLQEDIDIPDPLKMPGAGRILEDEPEAKIVKKKKKKDLSKKDQKRKDRKKKKKRHRER